MCIRDSKWWERKWRIINFIRIRNLSLHKLSGAVSRSNENSRRKSTTRTRMLNVQLLTEWQWPKYVWPQMFYNIDGNSLKQHARLWNDIRRNTVWKLQRSQIRNNTNMHDERTHARTQPSFTSFICQAVTAKWSQRPPRKSLTNWQNTTLQARYLSQRQLRMVNLTVSFV